MPTIKQQSVTQKPNNSPKKSITKSNNTNIKPKKKKRTRPLTTLFLVNSVDGRITSHDSDTLDPNKVWKHDPKIQAITQPFFDFARGNIHTLTYGESLVEIGVNTRMNLGKKSDVSLVVMDEANHLTIEGVLYLSTNFKTVYLGCLTTHSITTYSKIPTNLKLVAQKHNFNLEIFLTSLYKTHKVKQLSIQSNAHMNARWLSAGLIDYLSVIISPLLVGRHGTPNLIDQDMLYVKPLVLTGMKAFGLDFVNLRYDVINN
jgi:2,5-diamino-6-(ribosylamino)-4(3H)-pyrimidinone 5'-phosphate reductase